MINNINNLIIEARENKLSWKDVSNAVYAGYKVRISPDACRKRYSKYIKLAKQSNIDEKSSTTAQNLNDILLDIKKERVKLSDERIQNNAYIRQLSREETFKEIAENVIAQISEIKPLLSFDKPISKLSSYEGILCISDWHYGIDINSYWNVYNPDIAKQRVVSLLNSVINFINRYNLTKIYLLDLGDLISGIIHLPLRIQSREDVVSQVMNVCEIISEFISKLTEYVDIDYYSCLDNHSRIDPNKKTSIDLESFARFIPWYLTSRLKDNKRVKFINNKYSEDIITFNCMQYKVLALHGDKDKPNMMVNKLSTLTKDNYDLILTAHMHHFLADEKNTTVIVGNGTLMGTDVYSKNLRLSSNPSQNLIIVSEDNPVYAIHRILV